MTTQSRARAAAASVCAGGAIILAAIMFFALRSRPPREVVVGETPAGYYVRRARVRVRLPSIPADSAGMSAKRLDEIAVVVQRGIKEGGFPGAAVVIGRDGGAVLARGFGKVGRSDNAPDVNPDSTIYDLASLTKVVATTSAIMALYDDGVIHLDDRVVRWIPSFTGGYKDSVTIRQLLTHRSGLPPGRELWRQMGDPAAARAAVISTPLVKGCPPGSCYMYSDLGADMLGFIVEAASRESLDEFTERRVFDPLGMTSTTFHVPKEDLAYLAPTGAPRGRVHDSNAAALGGVAGHAGLFSTASDLAVFAQTMLDSGAYDGARVFRPETVKLFTTRAAGTRALGWDTCDSANVRATCGRYLSARAFGHTGFTGTSMWIDPDRRMFMILLTNRVDDPRVRRPALVIHDIRADIADAAVLSVVDADRGAPVAEPKFRSASPQRWQEPESKRRAKRGRKFKHAIRHRGSSSRMANRRPH
ncbi:MAG: beta-lactamase family protein [Gemmatimonadota bacterium]|nr:beta-lactamase family protein [Gemmatimonadota bacterium]